MPDDDRRTPPASSASPIPGCLPAGSHSAGSCPAADPEPCPGAADRRLAGWDAGLANGSDGTAGNTATADRTTAPAGTPAGPGLEPAGSGSPGTASGTFEPPDFDSCPTALEDLHQAADVETLLPRRLGGRDLSTWSTRGWCWVQLAAGGEGLAYLAPVIRDEGIDVTNLKYA